MTEQIGNVLFFHVKTNVFVFCKIVKLSIENILCVVANANSFFLKI